MQLDEILTTNMWELKLLGMQMIVEGLAILEPFLEVVGLGTELVIGELAEDVPRLPHSLGDGFEPAQFPAFAGA